MRRRDFFATLRGAAAWQFIGGALSGSMLAGPSVADEAERKRRIGVLMAHPASDPESVTDLKNSDGLKVVTLASSFAGARLMMRR